MSLREIGSSLDMISADEAARILRVSPRTVRRLCIDRKIPAVKVGNQWRIDRRSS
jgi:excisionase family DNA binding protein